LSPHGQVGCDAAIGMLADELRRAMQLLGVVSVAELRKRGPEIVQRCSDNAVSTTVGS